MMSTTRSRSTFSLERQSTWRWVDMYDDPRDLFEVTMLMRRDYVVEQAVARRGHARNVLDLGCGAGPLTAELAYHGMNVVGMDLSADLLVQASQRITTRSGRAPQVLRANCEVLPFRDQQFDVVACLGVIAFLDDEQRALEEMARVVRPGGTLVLSFRSAYALSTLLDPVVAAKKVVKRLLGLARRAPKRSVSGGARRFVPQRVIARLQRLGFTLEDVEHLGYGPIKFNNREILSKRASIGLSRWLARVFDLSVLTPLRRTSDVWILVLRKV
jgi:ubiquinone/menaquinone biosynthesis C-methylase UbiE